MYIKYLTRVFYYRHPRLSYMIANKNNYTLKKTLLNREIVYTIGFFFGINWYILQKKAFNQKKKLVLNNTV